MSSLEIAEVKTSKTTVTTSDIFDVSVTKERRDCKREQVKVSADGTSALLPVSQNLFIPFKTYTRRKTDLKYQPSPTRRGEAYP